MLSALNAHRRPSLRAAVGRETGSRSRSGRGCAMFGSKTILIADGSFYAALDLSQAVEDSEGCVAGPVDTLAEALTILDGGVVAGAIVDCELPEAAALIMRLTETGVPLVVQTSIPLPPP